MSIRTAIDAERNLVMHEVCGEVGVMDFVRAFRAQFEHAEFRDGMRVSWDLTDASIAIQTGSDFKISADLVRAEGLLRRVSKVAYIAPDDLTFGLARMFEMIGGAPDHELERPLKVFRTEQRALIWLDE